jgi:ribonuclease T2
VDIVLANGTFVSANATSNSDLFWALRGGGGSTWGIITAITVRAHYIPVGGFTTANAAWSGNYCTAGITKLNTFLEAYTAWILSLPKEFSGMMFITPNYTGSASNCSATWSAFVYYAYSGNYTDTAFQTYTQQMVTAVPPDSTAMQNYANWYLKAATQDLEPLVPV